MLIDRWTAQRKRNLVLAFQASPGGLDELLREHDISREEFDRWCQLYKAHGTRALRSTKVQDHRALQLRRDRI